MLEKCYKVIASMIIKSLGRIPSSVFAVVVLTALVALAGCGGGGDNESTGTTGPVASNEGGEGGEGSEGEKGNGDGNGNGGGSVGGSEGGGGASPGGSEGATGATGGSNGGSRKKQGASEKRKKSGKKRKKSGKKRKKSGKKQNPSLPGPGNAAPPPPTRTKAEFIKAADAICGEVEAQIKAGIQPYVQGSNLNSFAKEAPAIVQAVVTPNLESEINQIRALQPPADAEGAAGALLTSIQAMIGEAQAKPSEFVLGGKSVTNSEQVAAANGFTVCGGLA
jgi:hypothetical protein